MWLPTSKAMTAPPTCRVSCKGASASISVAGRAWCPIAICTNGEYEEALPVECATPSQLPAVHHGEPISGSDKIVVVASSIIAGSCNADWVPEQGRARRKALLSSVGGSL